MLHLRTLGDLRLGGADGEVLRGRRKELVLLAYLARRSPRPVRREELIGLLWDERDEIHARQSLRQALLQLRRALGDGVVVTRESVQLLDGVVELDVRVFEAEIREGRASAAVERWDGEFLLGAEDVGGETYRNWIETERGTLRRRLSAAFEQIPVVTMDIAGEQHAARLAERWTELFPHDEPPPALRHVREQLDTEARRTAPVAAANPGSAALFTPDLVGRDAALRELAAAWGAVQNGGSATVVVEASEGMGKTLLCDAFLETLEPDDDTASRFVLRARAREEDQAVPWKCARELLAALPHAPGLGGASGGALAECSRLVPAIAERFPQLPEPIGDDRALRSAVAEVLAVVAEEAPVVVFVDDLAYADAASLELILGLARHLTPSTFLLIAARPEWRAPKGALAELGQRPGVRRLVLQPLVVEEIETLVRSMVALRADDARSLAARLHAETGGNPFYAAETVSAMVDEGHLAPDASGVWRLADTWSGKSLPLSLGVRDAVRRRFALASPDAQQLAAAAAEMSDPMTRDRLKTASGLTAECFEVALDELIVRHLLRPARSERGAADAFEFAHAVVRRVAGARLAAAPSGRRRRETPRWWHTHLGRAIAGMVVVASVGVLGATILRARQATGSADEPPVIAVGRIEHLGGADSLGVAGAIGDMLATNLARVPALRVVSTARMYEVMALLQNGKDGPPAAWTSAARGAGAGELLEGGIHHIGDALQLDLRRVDVRTGAVRAGYTVRGKDAFDLVDRATAQIADAFGGPTGPLPVAEVTTHSVVAYRFYEEGLRSYAVADYPSARRLFDAALAEDSTFAMAAHYAALTRLELYEPVLLARHEALLRLAKHATDRDRLLIRGFWRELASASEVLAAAETLAVRYPTEPDGHHLLAMARLSGGDALGALPHARRVIAMDSLGMRGTQPRCRACEAFTVMVRAYQFADSAAAAERVAREWLQLQPRSARAWHELAAVLEMEGRFAEALAARRTAVSISPGHPYDALYPAMVRIQMGDFAEADARLRELAADGTQTVQSDALWFLTISLRNQGRLREGLETITRLEHMGQWGSAASQQRAQVLFELGLARDAAVLFDSIGRASFPQLVPGQIARHRSWNLVHQASALAAAGDTGSLSALADTLEWWGRRSSYGRDPRLHHHVRGLLLAARGQLEPAAGEFRSAIYSPTVGYSRTNLELATTLLRLHRPSDAVPVLQSALRGGIEGSSLYLTQTELHLALGRAWEAAGRPDSAVVQYRYVLAAWRNADPHFRARLDSVRARLTQSSGSR